MEINEILWENLENCGCEYLRLIDVNSEILAHGTVLFLSNLKPYQVFYELVLNQFWRVIKLKVRTEGIQKEVEITTNGQGIWYDHDGIEIHDLKGATDVDISVTPFSNTLPIRRTTWTLSQKRDFEVVYISIPDMKLKKIKQSYTFIKKMDKTRVFKYQSGSFETDILVDQNGIVIDYPTIFTRKY